MSAPAMSPEEVLRADCERSIGGRRPCDGDLDAMRARVSGIDTRIALIESHVDRLANAQERIADVLARRMEWVQKILDRIPWWGWPVMACAPLIAVVVLLLVIQGHGDKVLEAIPL